MAFVFSGTFSVYVISEVVEFSRQLPGIRGKLRKYKTDCMLSVHQSSPCSFNPRRPIAGF